MPKHLPEPLQGFLVNGRVRTEHNGDIRSVESHCGNREEKQSENGGKQSFHIVTRPG